MDNNCVSGAPHFDPEGAVCANDGLETSYSAMTLVQREMQDPCEETLRKDRKKDSEM